jgi:hypothetical protein
MKYKILYARSLKEMEKQVNEHLAQGWQPCGGLAIQLVPIEKVKAKVTVTDMGAGYFQSVTKSV